MSICRKYNIGTMIFVLLAIFLLAHFAVVDSNTDHENTRLIKQIPLSSAVSRVIIDRIAGCAHAHNSVVRSHSDHDIFLPKLRMILDDDWTAKIASPKPDTKITKRPPYLCNQFWLMFSGLTPSQGFRLSFSGLSPPPA